jgi:hypothetical protein
MCIREKLTDEEGSVALARHEIRIVIREARRDTAVPVVRDGIGCG